MAKMVIIIGVRATSYLEEYSHICIILYIYICIYIYTIHITVLENLMRYFKPQYDVSVQWYLVVATKHVNIFNFLGGSPSGVKQTMISFVKCSQGIVMED